MRVMRLAIAWALVTGCTPSKTDPGDTINADSGDAPWRYDDDLSIRENCFSGVGAGVDSFGSYDRFNPVMGRHCAGTHHQDIRDVEKLVFLGDSITAGTWPTKERDFYRHQLTALLQSRFGDIEVLDCSEYGARTDDFMAHSNRQINKCFPGLMAGETIEPKRTLVIWTMGGNDLLTIGDAAQAGGDTTLLLAKIDEVVEYQREALLFFKDQADTLFPAGVDVVFTNNYEFTDGTGDFGSCPTAATIGIDYTISSWALGYLTINESYMEMAVDTGTDMVLLMEHFCGHGFHADDPQNGCYKGPDTPIYFDPSCIHPTPEGHTALAKLFDQVIAGD
jgi:lysophospholipase L1-like esterase